MTPFRVPYLFSPEPVYTAAHKFHILLQYFIAVGLKQREIQYETFSRATRETCYTNSTKREIIKQVH